jgi:hypothetical protein
MRRFAKRSSLLGYSVISIVYGGQDAPGWVHLGTIGHDYAVIMQRSFSETTGPMSSPDATDCPADRQTDALKSQGFSPRLACLDFPSVY